MRPDVAVVTPTLRRPEGLERALRSVFAQVSVADRLREIVVADNDPAASARPVIEALRDLSPVPLVYAHAPVPGVATARNTALSATEAPLVAFLDDDEAAEPGWLEALIAVQEKTGADVVFGPITGKAPDGSGPAQAYLDRFFGREGPNVSGSIDHVYGSGNSLMVRATALPGAAPFDTDADHTGGEDDALFRELRARNGRFAWAADAWVMEYAPAHRATLAYAYRRAFAYGQGPSQTAVAERRPLAVLRWMVIGAGQAAVYGAAAGLMWLLRRPGRFAMTDRAVRGLGKVLWMDAFAPALYGRHTAKREAVSRPGAG